MALPPPPSAPPLAPQLAAEVAVLDSTREATRAQTDWAVDTTAKISEELALEPPLSASRRASPPGPRAWRRNPTARWGQGETPRRCEWHCPHPSRWLTAPHCPAPCGGVNAGARDGKWSRGPGCGFLAFGVGGSMPPLCCVSVFLSLEAFEWRKEDGCAAVCNYFSVSDDANDSRNVCRQTRMVCQHSTGKHVSRIDQINSNRI